LSDHFKGLRSLSSTIWSLDAVLQNLPAVVIDGRAADGVRHGASVTWSNVVSTTNGRGKHDVCLPLRIHDASGRLLAVGRLSDGIADRIAIEKVFVTDSV
jgi:hypothetical protein